MENRRTTDAHPPSDKPQQLAGSVFMLGVNLIFLGFAIMCACLFFAAVIGGG